MNTQESLRYVPVRDVESDLGTDDVTVESPRGDELGRLDGFLVDSVQHCLRYFVIRCLGPQSLTMARVPFVPARLDSEQGVLRLLDDAPAQTLASSRRALSARRTRRKFLRYPPPPSAVNS